MLKSIILVGIGGFAGSIARYLLSLAANQKAAFYNLPIGTLLANVFGSFLFGLFMAYLLKSNLQQGFWGLLLITGFCGGFTTFSTFTFENYKYLEAGQTFHFISYSIASFVLALIMVTLGHKVGKII